MVFSSGFAGKSVKTNINKLFRIYNKCLNMRLNDLTSTAQMTFTILCLPMIMTIAPN